MTTAETTEPRTEDVPPEQGARHRRVARRLRRPFALLCAVAFFFTPLVARLVGEHAKPIENHKLASFPSPSKGFTFFDAMNKWSIQHLPLRQYAIRGNAKLSEQVFGQPPAYGGNGDTGAGSIGTSGGVPGKSGSSNQSGVQGSGSGGLIKGTQYPTVIQGKNGWLYYGGDVSNACIPEGSVQQNMAAVNQLAQAVRASGRRFVFAVAPNKSTVYPKYLPATFLGKDCLDKRSTAFWNALKTAPPGGYLPLRGPLEAQQKADGVSVYRQTDTHWGPRGAAVYAHQLADALQPGLWKGTRVVSTGKATRTGDLSVLSGNPHVDTFPGWKVVRPGVTTPNLTASGEIPAVPRQITNTTTGVPLFAPKTLLLGDSYTAAALTDVVPLFAHLTLTHNTSSVGHMSSLLKAFTDNQVIVFEIVERTQEGGHTTTFQPKYLDQIVAALKAHPLR